MGDGCPFIEHGILNEKTPDIAQLSFNSYLQLTGQSSTTQVRSIKEFMSVIDPKALNYANSQRQAYSNNVGIANSRAGSLTQIIIDIQVVNTFLAFLLGARAVESVRRKKKTNPASNEDGDAH